MRADRLLSLLLILRQRERATARQLAAELEVSQRTVLRDIDALSVAGVPVYADRGRNGGFALLAGWTTDVSGLTAPEAQAVLAAGSRSSARELGLGGAFASGLNKLLATMPEEQRQRTVAATSRILVTSDGFVPSSEETPHLALLQRAVVDGRRLRLGYRTRSSVRASRRTVDPIGLISANAVWYLLADHRGERRTYRVGRIASAALLDEPARRDPTVDLAAAWDESRASFRSALEAITVTVDVRHDALPRLLHEKSVLLDGADPEWQRIEVPFGDRRQAVGVLWSLGPAARVVAPGWLAEELLGRAAEMVTRGGGSARPRQTVGR